MMIGEVLSIEDPRQLLSDLIVAVRKVRDQRGDDRCHMDLTALYQLLPEGDTRPREDTLLTLENCAKYIAATLDPNITYVSPQRRIDELEALIGQPPVWSHPDEWKPRAATWHEERQNWIKEAEDLRKSLDSFRAAWRLSCACQFEDGKPFVECKYHQQRRTDAAFVDHPSQRGKDCDRSGSVKQSESLSGKAEEKMSEPTFKEWCVLELMGHRRLGGLVSEQTIAGNPFLRIDIPSEPPLTQFYNAKSVYAMTPCGEAEARAVARGNTPDPVQRWEIPQLAPARDIDDADYTPIAPEESEDSPERHWDANEFEADTKENPY